MNAISCLVMLEDKKEELACLHVLGLLPEPDDAAFVATLDSDEEAARAVREFRDSLTNLHLSTTAVEQPPEGARERLFDRLAAEPARVATDAEGRIESINPSFTEMCGFRLHELAGKKPGHVLQGTETDPSAIATLRKAIAAGTTCDVEMMNYHKNGTPYWVKIHIEPIRDPSGKLTGFEAEEKKLPMPGGAPASC